MKKNFIIYLFLSFLILIVGFPIFAVWYTKYTHLKIQKHKTMYCYQTFWGPANTVLYIKDLKFKEELIDYYKKVERGENPSFNFPLMTLPTDRQVYVIDTLIYNNLIAEIICYETKESKIGANYTKGYVYIKTLHNNPPIN